jgi:hypothetical protein
MTSLRPAWLEIDIDALALNVRLHRRAAGPDYRGHDGALLCRSSWRASPGWRLGDVCRSHAGGAFHRCRMT